MNIIVALKHNLQLWTVTCLLRSCGIFEILVFGTKTMAHATWFVIPRLVIDQTTNTNCWQYNAKRFYRQLNADNENYVYYYCSSKTQMACAIQSEVYGIRKVIKYAQDGGTSRYNVLYYTLLYINTNSNVYKNTVKTTKQTVVEHVQ